MRIAFFHARAYERPSIEAANAGHGHEIGWFEATLAPQTAALAQGHDAVCIFVNDICNAEAIGILADAGVRLILCRSAGYNQVDLTAARAHGMTVMRVPGYSPESVAEHTVGLILSLVRHLHHQHNRVRDGNYALDGLVGFKLHEKTAGICGTGRVGRAVARILNGFGCRLLGYDVAESDEMHDLGMTYVDRDTLLAEADIVILTLPLTPETWHLIDAESLKRVKPGAVLVNTGRGALVDTRAAIDSLIAKGGLGYLGLDVYEEEAGKFFEDMSAQIVPDETLLLLTNLRNALVTPHSAFLTRESLAEIAAATIGNATDFERGSPDPDRVVS